MPNDKWYINRTLRGQEMRLSAALDLASDVMVAEIRIRTPVDKGDLKGSNAWRALHKLVRRIFNNKEYAPDVEFGTPPHVIRPRFKKAMYWKGAKHPVKKVNHPGTPAQPFMRPGFRAAIPKIKQLMKRV